jgi:hypothetical protein
VKQLKWRGGNNDQDRKDGASLCRDKVRCLLAGSASGITIVGHSHGGNVALRAISLLGKQERERCEVVLHRNTLLCAAERDLSLFYSALKRHNLSLSHGACPICSHGISKLRPFCLYSDQSNSQIGMNGLLACHGWANWLFYGLVTVPTTILISAFIFPLAGEISKHINFVDRLKLNIAEASKKICEK